MESFQIPFQFTENLTINLTVILENDSISDIIIDLEEVGGDVPFHNISEMTSDGLIRRGQYIDNDGNENSFVLIIIPHPPDNLTATRIMVSMVNTNELLVTIETLWMFYMVNPLQCRIQKYKRHDDDSNPPHVISIC